jgi:ornithine cyclodeaminase/alanine dehydrogenase-like protein (mu-crystallin family)
MITADQLKATLTWSGLVTAMIDGHRDERPDVQRVWMEDGPNGYLVWHGWARGSVIVTKMGTVIPGNPHGPAVQAIVVVFDARTGTPIGLIDGTELTYWKTAAVSAMAAHYLAPAQSRTLLMVGAGDLAPYLAEAHIAVRPSIDRVLVWNRTPEKAAALAARLPGASVASDLDSAVAEADVISCATASEVPLVRGATLSAGTHLDLVGGFTPSMHEVDNDAVGRSTLFVDHDLTSTVAGDLLTPFAAGVRSAADIVADLFDLAHGRHQGRSTADEITLFKSAGGAHLDLFASRHALAVVNGS